MLWFRSSRFTKAILRVHSLCLSPSLLDQAGGQDADHSESSLITPWFLLSQGTCFPFGCHQNAEALHHAEHTSYHTGRYMCETPVLADGDHRQLHLCARLRLLPWLLPVWIQECLQAMELNACFSRMFSLLAEYLESICLSTVGRKLEVSWKRQK